MALALGSVGVVYGDIGTSPLYAFREAVIAASDEPGRHARHRARRAVADPVGADHHRDAEIRADPAARRQQRGGRHALAHGAGHAARSAGAPPSSSSSASSAPRCFSATSVITPAISVLSAVEGLKLASPAFSDYVAPLAVVILIGLFAAQSRGTAKVAALFGPVMVVWFVAIAIAGALHIRDDPHVLLAINPLYGIEFLLTHGADRPGDARRGVPGGDRRRGALCRSRPFRPQADPDRMALPGAAGAADQLFRAGRQGAGRSGGDRKSVLPPGAGNLPAADDRAGDGGDRDREPGGDHRRLFAGASGDPARPAAAARHPAHLGLPCRPDLYSARDDGAAGRRVAAGRTVPHLERAGVRLWHRGCHHHGGRRVARPSSSSGNCGSGRCGRPRC